MSAWIALELVRAPDALQPVVLLLILMIAAVDLLPMPTTLLEGERLPEQAPQNPRR